MIAMKRAAFSVWLLVPKELDLNNHLTIDVSFSCVCPVIDYEFRHNIVKEAVDQSSGSADYFDNVMTKFIVYNRTDA